MLDSFYPQGVCAGQRERLAIRSHAASRIKWLILGRQSQVKISFKDAAETPDLKEWPFVEADETAVKEICRKFSVQGSFVCMEVGVCRYCSMHFQPGGLWEVWLDSSAVERRSCTMESQLAFQLLAAAFRKEDLGAFANSTNLDWKWHIHDTFHHPGCSKILPDGTIVMKAGGHAHVVWDGTVEIKPSHPYYSMWLWVVRCGRWNDPDVFLNNEDVERIAQEYAESQGNRKGE